VAAKWKKVASHEVKRRSNDLTKLFDSYSTNNHYISTEQLVWVVGFDDRKKETAAAQLVGHTKTYTKVVIAQDALGGQPAQALIGKCVKVKVVETTKWHIAGYVIDANPRIPEAPADYFERLQREEEEADVVMEKIVVKHSTQQVGLHLLGMVLMTIGLFVLFRSLLF